MPTFDADAQRVYAMLDRLENEAEDSCVETSSANGVIFVHPATVEMAVKSPFHQGGQTMDLLTT